MRIRYFIKRFFFHLKNENILEVLKKILKTIFKSNKINLDQLHIDENISLDDLFIKFK